SRLSKTAGIAAVHSTPVKQDLEKVPVVENGQVKPKHGHNMVVQPVQPHIAQAQIESTPQLIPESKAPQISDAETGSSVATIQKTGFSQVEGIEYVDSEYLENKEFNLEGKKRFYSMPEGVVDKNIGTTRIQTIE